MICMKKLEVHAGGAEFNIFNAWGRLALDNLFLTSFGMDNNVQDNEKDESLNLVNR